MRVPGKRLAQKRNHTERADAPEGRASRSARPSAIMQTGGRGATRRFPAGPQVRPRAVLEWTAIVERRRGGADGRVERRGVLEIEQALERVGELVAAREMRAAIGIAAERRQEALLDQSQDRSVIGDLMRHVVRLCE